MSGPVWELTLIALSGLCAGFINAMAGGGSLLTLPALMLSGLPADLANGSNRLSVVAQGISSTWAYTRAGKIDKRTVPQLILPTCLGSLLGAAAASYTPVEYLKPILLCTLAGMAVLMTIMPRLIKTSPDSAPKTLQERPAAYLGLLLAGFYAGYVQAGVGFVLLAVLEGALHFDLIRANALKVAVTVLFGVVSLAVFAARGQVAWLPASVLALTSVVGSLLGVRFALRVDQKLLRHIIVGAVLVVCIAALLRD